MLLKLTQEYVVCAECRKGFIGIEKFQQHVNSEHIGVDIVEHIREFDWVHLKIGDGHYEMNLKKAFIDMNWDVFFKELVLRMGWRSEVAQKAARNCYDNQKTWQLILVHHFGSLMELIIPYVRSCISNKDSCLNADGFFEYAKTCEHDPNYTFLFEMTTRYSQAIVNFRMGTSRNNSQLIHSAKYMFRGLFHGRCHPKYQLIEMYDSMQRYLQPED
ncbi:unnamed protein product [Mytilus coruscus]|uniref:C2H2-type domain-containing protein n=1 Tax=Mytilus coruscus TaxID=42192 RepID=A0A6J8D304_MYTCO|nr:unnamed protein product [Mytilus coruscus]